jgi:hypothetical protein
LRGAGAPLKWLTPSSISPEIRIGFFANNEACIDESQPDAKVKIKVKSKNNRVIMLEQSPSWAIDLTTHLNHRKASWLKKSVSLADKMAANYRPFKA